MGLLAPTGQNPPFYDERPQANSIKSVPILAARGRILDRGGRTIDDPAFAKYEPGAVIGKFGIDCQYNDTLMGVNGHPFPGNCVIRDQTQKVRDAVQSCPLVVFGPHDVPRRGIRIRWVHPGNNRADSVEQLGEYG